METGPYQAWQVAGLVIGVAVVSLLAAWRGHPAVAIAVMPAVMTLCFAFDAAPDSPLLVIGAVLVALGTLIEVTLVASSVVIVRGQRGFR